MDIWKRIIRLERTVNEIEKSVPGTIVSRTIYGWSLSLGNSASSQRNFYGTTIDDCILQAEELYNLPSN